MRWLKSVPNGLTLLNLGIGLAAIACLYDNHIVLILGSETAYYGGDVIQKNLLYGLFPWACILVIFASIFDFADGFAARILNAQSALGAQLDSLADLVSFGVVPSLIARELFLMGGLNNEGAMDIPLLITYFPFIICMAGAYRLARFNTSSHNSTDFFEGMPIPFGGIIIACLGLSRFFQEDISTYLVRNIWVFSGIIAFVSYCMQSKIPFISLKFSKKSTINTFRYIFVGISGLSVICFYIFGLGVFSSILIIIILHLIISQMAKKSIV